MPSPFLRTAALAAALLAVLSAPAAATASARSRARSSSSTVPAPTKAALALAMGGRVLAGSAPAGQPGAVLLPAPESGQAISVTRVGLGGHAIVISATSPHHRGLRLAVRSASGRQVALGPAGRLGTHTLVVSGTDLSGRPDTSGYVLVGNVADSDEPGTGIAGFRHGIAKFQVTSGTYWATAVFLQITSGKLTAIRMDVLPQFRVSGNTTVRTSARAATSRVTMRTPRPAITQSSSLTIVRAAPHAPANALSPKIDSLSENTSTPLWISPVSHRPGYGTMRVFTSAQATPARGQPVPYAYTLDFADPTGTIPAQHFTARPSGLATVSERYFQDVRSVAGWATVGGTPYQIDTSGYGGLTLPLQLPARQIQYISARPAMLWQTTYAEYRTIATGQTQGGQTSAFRLLHAGEHLTQDWNAYPLHPGPNVSFPSTRTFVVQPSAGRAGNSLSLDITPFSDNQTGHTGGGLLVPFPGKVNDVSGSYAVYQDGAKIAGGNAVSATGGLGDLFVTARLSPRPSLIRFVLSASRAGRQYRFSAASRDVWTWHSRRQPGSTVPAPWLCDSGTGPPQRHCAVQPMITLNYRVAGLGLNGTARPGRQTVTVTVGHIQLAPRYLITHAVIRVSFNGGRTWRNANVTAFGADRYCAVFTAPRSARVSLSVTARDAAGNSLSETIQRAYQTTV